MHLPTQRVSPSGRPVQRLRLSGSSSDVAADVAALAQRGWHLRTVQRLAERTWDVQVDPAD